MGGRARLRALTAAAVLLALLGAGLLAGARYQRSGADTGNRALTDRAATDRVTREVGDALARILSYSAADTDATRAAAAGWLTGPAGDQYRGLLDRLRGWVGDQQLTLTSEVVSAGVIRLSGDRAELLVLLDQHATRAGGPPTVTAAQLRVTARLDGGRWL
ncbi:hypothetical protein, partial [Kitasatospora sp. MBT63]|uniref:hypothetical protein n=1 Tax=Kitasatospora sp. MBT63 TaxID=1444768 RepID=UPI00053975B3